MTKYGILFLPFLKNAKFKEKEDIWYGAFVSYDDSPRRGRQGKIVKGESPGKFEKYLKELARISDEQNKPYIFLTAWNEWGEGAYLEPDTDNGYAFLEAVNRVSEIR